MTLEELPIGTRARITAVDWASLAPDEGQRLRAMGLDQGAHVAVAHRGVFAGRDPLSIMVGRMNVAIRRSHALAMEVEAL